MSITLITLRQTINMVTTQYAQFTVFISRHEFLHDFSNVQTHVGGKTQPTAIKATHPVPVYSGPIYATGNSQELIACYCQ